jgi:hypothetical protein
LWANSDARLVGDIEKLIKTKIELEPVEFDEDLPDIRKQGRINDGRRMYLRALSLPPQTQPESSASTSVRSSQPRVDQWPNATTTSAVWRPGTSNQGTKPTVRSVPTLFGVKLHHGRRSLQNRKRVSALTITLYPVNHRADRRARPAGVLLYIWRKKSGNAGPRKTDSTSAAKIPWFLWRSMTAAPRHEPSDSPYRLMGAIRIAMMLLTQPSQQG